MDETIRSALLNRITPPLLIVTDWMPTTNADLEDGATYPDLTRAGMGPRPMFDWQITERATGGHAAISPSIVFHNNLAEGNPVNVVAVGIRLYIDGAYINFAFQRLEPARVVPGRTPLYLGYWVITSYVDGDISYNTLSIVGSFPKKRK